MIFGLSQLFNIASQVDAGGRGAMTRGQRKLRECQSTKTELTFYSWLAVLVPFSTGVARIGGSRPGAGKTGNGKSKPSLLANIKNILNLFCARHCKICLRVRLAPSARTTVFLFALTLPMLLV
jgi:hypothetical protein